MVSYFSLETIFEEYIYFIYKDIPVKTLQQYKTLRTKLLYSKAHFLDFCLAAAILRCHPLQAIPISEIFKWENWIS